MLEFQAGQSRTVQYWVDDAKIDSSASAPVFRVIDSAGTTVSSGAAVISSPRTALTIASVTDEVTVVITESAAATAASGYQTYYQPPAELAQSGETLTLSNVKSTVPYTLTFESPPSQAFAVGGVFYTNGVSASVSSIADVGRGYRIEWDISVLDKPSGQSELRTYTTAFDVVRSPLGECVSMEDATRFMHMNWPGAASSFREARFRSIARRASARIHTRLRASSAYPHTVMDRTSLELASQYALRVECALDGLVVPGHDPDNYIQSMSQSLKESIQDILKGAWVDTDDDGVLDAGEERMFTSFKAVRR